MASRRSDHCPSCSNISFDFRYFIDHIGLTEASSLSSSLTSAACAASIIPDDMLNGNISNSGTSYFSGLVTLNTQFGYFAGNLSSVIVPAINDLTDNSSNSAMSTAISDGQAALNSIKLISDGNTGAA